MNKKVSIIVPVYNAADYLDRCMKSLLEQSYSNVEIVLIDDGSTDESSLKCDKFANKYERVKVIHTPNAGVSAARNCGIETCGGDYLTFVDADDVLSGDMITYLVDILEQTGSDVAGCDYWEFSKEEDLQKRVQEDTQMLKCAKLSESVETPEHTEMSGSRTTKECIKTESLIGNEFIEKGILRSDTRCWSKLYKKESIGSLRFESGLTIGEDMLFLLRLAQQGKRFVRSSYKAYGYFSNPSGAMRQGFKDSYMDQITCWQKALEMIAKEIPGETARAESILIISVMLTVGKLALLSAKERKEKQQYINECSKLIRKYAGNKAAMNELDKGYKIKVAVYRWMPQLYLALYGKLLMIKRS